jgi:hypothetical protein
VDKHKKISAFLFLSKARLLGQNKNLADLNPNPRLSYLSHTLTLLWFGKKISMCVLDQVTGIIKGCAFLVIKLNITRILNHPYQVAFEGLGR